MTSKSQPNNATPQRLQLAPQSIPRMPFSSPMGEEILSPLSPNASRSPPQHQIQLSQNRGGQENTRRNNQAQQFYAPPKSTKGEWGTENKKGSDKPRWQGLHVATDLSKPPVLAQKAADRDARQDQGLKLKGSEKTAPSISVSVETLSLGRQQSKKILKPSGSKGRLGDLSRASSKFSNLSPSDRAVVIGLSVSPEEFAEHATSPVDSAADSRGLSEEHAPAKWPSAAPTITVTPANKQRPWAPEEDERSLGRRKRAASSVYSQATAPNTSHFTGSSVVPPIPPLPPDAQRHNAQVSRSRDKQGEDALGRVISTCTVFEDEESPEVAAKSRSVTGHLKILTKQSSMDTIATRHRSQGWWNHIVSPFFPKSPMSLKFPSSTTARESASAALDPHLAATASHDRCVQDSRVPPYSEVPKVVALGSSHTSWTDSTLEAELEKRAIDFDGSPTKRSTLVIGGPPPPSPPPAKFEGFGAAAEYYEACLYDMHSPEPFFECQNHTCLPRRTDLIKAAPGGMSTGTRGVTEELGLNGRPITRQKESGRILAVQQAPKNRFSAAFHEVIASKSNARPDSEATVIEELDSTPDVQEAHIAPVLRAPAPVPATQPLIPQDGRDESEEVEEAPQPIKIAPRQPPAHSSPQEERAPKKFTAVLPPYRTPAPYETRYEEPLSPDPVSPVMQRQVPRNAIPMAEVRRERAEPITPMPISPMDAHNRDSYFQEADRYDSPRQTTLADLYPPPREKTRVQRKWDDKGKEFSPREPKPQGGKCKNCFSSAKPKNKREKRIMIAIGAGLVLLVIFILVLTMTLTRKSNNKMSVQSQWLNLTGYPPIPTGLSTIVQPNNVDSDPSCVEPSTMWSCAVPKEEQQDIYPNAPNQPNFRVEILFQNGTKVTANSTVGNASSVSRRSYGHIANAVSAGGFIRNHLLQLRNAFSNNAYSPSPAPPSLEDQTFLGNTTDDNAVPFDGEYTPFFMTFESATKLSSRLLKRASSNANSSDPFPNPIAAIPPPDSNPDGTAVAANLYPYPSAQPLRLYNRGLDTEHYGFYTYFDRSIFLKSTAPINNTSNDTTPVPDDEDGGADELAASVRCTWTQTRFLVQIWTRKGSPAPLLQSGNTTSISHSSNPMSNTNVTSLTSSSANDFSQPGSFPYPVTITLDRHGGDISMKMIYCYGINDREQIIPNEKKVQLEDRGVGGQLVNPALGPFGDVNVTTAQGGPGGIDGGTGGCWCRWQNWAPTN